MLAGRSALRRCQNVWQDCFRVKRQYRLPTVDPKSSITLSTLDLTCFGVSSVLGTGVYVISGHVATDFAGPSVLLSLVIAAIASLISGLCYAELAARCPRMGGPAYSYLYYQVGEGVAFLVGWTQILQYIFSSAANARAIAECVDFITGNAIENFTAAHVGEVSGTGSYPNFLSVLPTVVMTILLVLSINQSGRFALAANVINVCVIGFITVVGVFHVDFKNWTNGKGFFPYDVDGVFVGAAISVYAFAGTDAFSTSGENTRIPSQSVPFSIMVTMISCFLVYMGAAGVMTLLAPSTELVSSLPLAEVYVLRGAHWMKYVVCCGAALAIFVCLFSTIKPISKLLHSMAEDGLLCQLCAKVYERTDSPIIPILSTSSVILILSVILDVKRLLEVMAITTLFVHTTVCTFTLMIRYRLSDNVPRLPGKGVLPGKHESKDVKSALKKGLNIIKDSVGQSKYDQLRNSPTESNGTPKKRVSFTFEESYQGGQSEALQGETAAENNMAAAVDDRKSESDSDTDIDAYVDEYMEKLRVAAVTSTIGPNKPEPTDVTAKTAAYTVSTLVFLIIVISSVITFGITSLSSGNVLLIIFLCFVLLISFFMVLFLYRQPEDYIGVARLSFKVPLFPWLPIIAILLDVHLMQRLAGWSWAVLTVWVVLGLVLYLSYGIKNSTEGTLYSALPDEERVLLQPIPRHPLTNKILRSHRHSDRADVRLQEIDTVLIER